MHETPTREGTIEAAAKIGQILPPTPLLPVTINGTNCHVKAENLQPIGAFKIRGAWHKLTSIPQQERANGVVAVSSGNHAQGVAWSARKLGIKATIVMPHDAPQVKLDATRALGAEVVLYKRAAKHLGGEDRDEVAARLIEQSGATLVHAFGDARVIEGQGSAGVEIAVQMAKANQGEPSRIVACCGGGGLAAGLSLACPNAEIVPVEPVGWDMVGQSLEVGGIVHAADDAPPTICDALQPTATKPINLGVLSGRSEPGVTVSDAEVRAAQRFAFTDLRLVTEPGGAAASAAALAGKVTLDSQTVVMITGGNVDPAQFGQVIASST